MDFSQFISQSPHKTPPMLVHVINSDGVISYTYEAPAGFQLDRYVASLFPNAELMVYANRVELNVSVVIPETQEVYQVHQGIYRFGG